MTDSHGHPIGCMLYRNDSHLDIRNNFELSLFRYKSLRNLHKKRLVRKVTSPMCTACCRVQFKRKIHVFFLSFRYTGPPKSTAGTSKIIVLFIVFSGEDGDSIIKVLHNDNLTTIAPLILSNSLTNIWFWHRTQRLSIKYARLYLATQYYLSSSNLSNPCVVNDKACHVQAAYVSLKLNWLQCKLW